MAHNIALGTSAVRLFLNEPQPDLEAILNQIPQINVHTDIPAAFNLRAQSSLIDIAVVERGEKAFVQSVQQMGGS